MAIPFLIIGAAAVIGVAVIGAFWNDIKKFVSKAFQKFREIFIPAAIVGFKTFLQTGSVARSLYAAGKVAIQKCYSKTERGTWQETVVAREISFDEIPADIRERVERSRGKEVDITGEVAEELQLEHN